MCKVKELKKRVAEDEEKHRRELRKWRARAEAAESEARGLLTIFFFFL